MPSEAFMRTRLSIVVSVIVAGLLIYCLRSRTSGLFNNIPSEQAALQAHASAWKQAMPEPLGWSRFQSAIRDAGGTCVSLSRVPPYRPQDANRYSCELTVGGRAPEDLGFSYGWVVVAARTGERAEIERVSRKKFGL